MSAAAGYAVSTVDELPSIREDGVDWRPIQHYFGLTAFGVNVYRAEAADTELIGLHGELQGDHEEVYMVLEGRVRFTLAGEIFECARGAVVAVTDPAVWRRAVALTVGAAVLAVGNRRAERFVSTWNPDHFEGVPTVRDPE